MTDDKHSAPASDAASGEKSPRTTVMGVRDGKGADQYGGSFGGGQSGGGSYATPHGTAVDDAQDTGGGQGGGNRSATGSQTGYHGGGQAGAANGGGGDHHAANRGDGAADNAATYRDHPSQQGAPTADQSDRSIDRGVGNPDLAGEALEPGDRVQGADRRPVTGKP
ncbi:hypothetical protein [Polymorphobacter fuscus]|uniref:Uncharacterized protein n=1 Tax=Sandarakinorhabdus fusca TaxID=1439888 RepID=A0A7C9GPW7_9SPHN|nr:hypothetical protein [Polymorphobacter fuscus]KAB7647753.1 hypothetical protein F9290_07230 [Polymorphobacter fuscus]MQT17050.1 hypothetical protein [Polymorphobacter fuscus]NJC08958.1 hypothetical protein [Polymorphobacter fuscus]